MSILSKRRSDGRKAEQDARNERKLRPYALGRDVIENEPVIAFPRTYFG